MRSNEITQYLVIDTSVIVRMMRNQKPSENWNRVLLGRLPVVSPVTLYELRRGVRPGSPWEKNIEELIPSDAIVCDAPTQKEWVIAADVLRKVFWGRDKSERALLQNDVLIALSAQHLRAELWAFDGDFKQICLELGVPLIMAS